MLDKIDQFDPYLDEDDEGEYWIAEKDLVLKLRDFYCDVVGLSEGFRPAFERFGFWLYIGDKDVLHLITPKDGDARSSQKSSFDHVGILKIIYRLFW